LKEIIKGESLIAKEVKDIVFEILDNNEGYNTVDKINLYYKEGINIIVKFINES